jgi:hypothetical protein
MHNPRHRFEVLPQRFSGHLSTVAQVEDAIRELSDFRKDFVREFRDPNDITTSDQKLMRADREMILAIDRDLRKLNIHWLVCRHAEFGDVPSLDDFRRLQYELDL